MMERCDVSRHSVVPPITPNQVIYFPLTECLVKVTEVLRGHALLFLPFLFLITTNSRYLNMTKTVYICII